MSGRPKPAGEGIFRVLFFILGVTIMVSSLQIGFGRFTVPGPGLFPFFCGLLLSVQGIALHLVKQRTATKQDDALSQPGAVPKFLRMMGIFVLWIFLMPALGWLPLTFLATLSIAKLMGMKGWRKPLLLAGVNTAFSYLLFGYLLAIDLPGGFWT